MSEEPSPRRGIGRGLLLRPWPFYALLFAAYPVLFLFSRNLGLVEMADVVEPLVVVVLVALAVLLLLGLLLKDIRRAAIIVGALIVPILAYGQVGRTLGRIGLPTRFVEIGMIVWVVLAVVLALRIRGSISIVTRALNLMGVVAVLLTLVAIVPYQIDRLGRPSAVAAPLPSGATGNGTGVATTRDVYFVILDRYGSASSLKADSGAESGFYDWLTQHGFHVQADAHANYESTTTSLASTLNMTMLDELAARMGPTSDDYKPLNDMIQNNAVGRFFQAHGYRYIQLGSHFDLTRRVKIADLNLNINTSTDFVDTFYDGTALPAIERRLGVAEHSAFSDRHYDSAVYQFNTLDWLRTRPGPKFVFAHILLPHPPFVFLADGSYAPRGTPGGATLDTQLAYTNTKVEAWLESLLALPEATRPIVILEADEGGYPQRYAHDQLGFDWSQATTDELEGKYGILNAWYTPDLTDAQTGLYPTISSVNTFRLLFHDYFGADLPLLPDRSFTYRNKDFPYDFTEITSRLPSLGGP